MRVTVVNSTAGRGQYRGFVYRCFDADGRPLYVGVTRNPTKRFTYHVAGKRWWRDVTLIEVVAVRGSRLSAHEFECQEIARLRPLHNRHHNPDWWWDAIGRQFVPAELRRYIEHGRRTGADVVPLRGVS